MASRSAKHALALSLAVIAATLVVITAGWQLTSTTSGSAAPASGGPAAAAKSEAGAQTQGSAAGHPAQRQGAGTKPAGSKPGAGVRGSAPPATPVKVIISSRGRRVLSAPVDPMAATRNPDGSWAPIKPPHLSRAVWMSQSAPPAAPSTGTTAIYGHACIGFPCAFNNAVRARVGSTVTLETARSVLRYRVNAVVQYPKSGARSLTSRPNVPNELLLVTCAYRADESSVNNLVLVADLVSAQSGPRTLHR